MNYTVFYSWQSDVSGNLNRSFIADALEKAIKSVSRSEDFSLEAVIDRDTYGIPGSPSIVESITGKIAKSDVFVCDISIVNPNSVDRKTPNPNVLYELGFASAILGWDRIILVQNVAFGGPESLPFDLRGRRILTYTLDDAAKGKPEEKLKLKKQLVDTFKSALKYYSHDIVGTQEKVIWWGHWQIRNKVKTVGGDLHISRVSSDAFFFTLSIYDGKRSGLISGKAQILTSHSAYGRLRSYSEADIEIIFRRRLQDNAWCIEVEEGAGCDRYHGLSATFSGIYWHQNESVINWGYLDEIDMNEIERITGKYLYVFLDNFQHISVDRYHNGEELTTITGAVKGLYTVCESIVVLDQRGNLWCACLDPQGESNVVRYFTNCAQEPHPEPIREWLENFSERELIVNQR